MKSNNHISKNNIKTAIALIKQGVDVRLIVHITNLTEEDILFAKQAIKLPAEQLVLLKDEMFKMIMEDMSFPDDPS